MKTNTIYIAFGLITVLLTNLACNHDEKKSRHADSIYIKKVDSVSVPVDQKIDSLNIIIHEDWLKFKKEANAKIQENNEKIDELRARQSKEGKMSDNAYSRKIDKLKEKNQKMKDKIESFDSTTSDWQKFRDEFNHDMNELGKAIAGIVKSSK